MNKRPAKKTINTALRFSVWDTYGGADKRTMQCYCGCGRIIRMENFHCGHVIAESRGGSTTLENLRPICSICNLSMRTKSMIDFCRESGYAMRANIIIDLTQTDDDVIAVNDKLADLSINDAPIYPFPPKQPTVLDIILQEYLIREQSSQMS